MSIIKKIFGIRPSKRTDVPNGLRGTGVLGGNGIFDEYFNQILFEIQADHIVDTEANVKLTDDPRGTCYYNSTSSEFQDSSDATVTFSDGDKIAWRGLDAITSDIDISTIDDLEHVMFQGVTIALGSQTLSLGENQRGELKYSGTASALSGSAGIGTYEDFKTKNLIINVQSNTTVDADADNIIFVDQFGGGKRVDNINETFDINIDRPDKLGTTQTSGTFTIGVAYFIATYVSGDDFTNIGGTNVTGNTFIATGTTATTYTNGSSITTIINELASTWYQKWLDSDRNKAMLPDLEGVADSDVLNSLSDSAAAFQTHLVQRWDEIYQTTDLLKGYVKAVSTENVITVMDKDGNDLDLFPLGTESYKIRMLSPTGLGTVRARIGAAYNNSGSNLDDSTYTQIQEEKTYNGAGVDFATTSDHETTAELVQSIARVSQVNDWTGAGFWFAELNTTYNYAATYGGLVVTYAGIVFKNTANYDQPVLVSSDINDYYQSRANSGASTITILLATGSTDRPFISGKFELERKPTFAK